MRNDPFAFKFLLFPGHLFIKSWNNLFFTNFRIVEPFNLDYVIRFCKPKKELSYAIFTIKILVAETFGLGTQLKYCLPIFHV